MEVLWELWFGLNRACKTFSAMVMSSGVPQGSIPTHFLFCIHMLVLGAVVNKNNIHHHWKTLRSMSHLKSVKMK